MRYAYRLIIRMFIAFLLFLLPFNIFYIIFLKLTLWLSYLALIGYKPDVFINSLMINGVLLVFTSACIATSAYYLFTLLVILVKDLKFIDRLRILGLGFLFILLGNVARIVILIVLYLNNSINWFENLHLIFWKFISGAYVALVWIFLSWRFKLEMIPAYSDLLELKNRSIFGRVFRSKIKKRRMELIESKRYKEGIKLKIKKRKKTKRS